MKVTEIREFSPKEREEKVKDLRQEYFNLRFQLATGKIENTSRLRHLRRDIARIKTVQRQETVAGGKKPEAAASEKK